MKDVCGLLRSANESEVEEEIVRSGGESGLLWSRRQAELFIARQTARLQNHEESALPAAQLQQIIRQVLQANPDHFEAVTASFSLVLLEIDAIEYFQEFFILLVVGRCSSGMNVLCTP